MPKRQLYLVCYDIADHTTRRHALKLVRRYAMGGQKSVHECWLTAKERDALFADLSYLTNEHTDSIVIVRLDPRQLSYALGGGVIPEYTDWFYIG